MQRLSGESEITAMKAGGISFTRMTIPLLAAGLVMSLVTFIVQEFVTPFAADQVGTDRKPSAHPRERFQSRSHRLRAASRRRASRSPSRRRTSSIRRRCCT